MNFSTQPVELCDCEVRGIGSGAELFIVEGDSAAKAVDRVRDARFQAVLPMQGKPLNALKANKAAVGNYLLYAKLIEAIGAGWDDSLDSSSARFDRILLLMDPDADGIHCGTLLLLFFYRWMRPLLDAGKLRIVRAPMLEISSAGLERPIFCLSEDEARKVLNDLDAVCRSQATKHRFRGLASMSVQTLSKTCIEPATRKCQQLSSRDAESAIAFFENMRLA